MNLLITGAAGFIGANFAHYAARQGHRVLVYDLLTYAGNPKNVEGIHHFIRGDIRDAITLDRVFADGIDGAPFDAVVNFAAESHVDRSISMALPFVETNVLGAVTLLESARRNDVVRFIQISTDEVYGSIEGMGKFTPDSCLKPSSAYSASKAAADHLLLSFHRTHGYDVRMTRCTNNYGRFQHPEKFIPTILTNALAHRPIPIFGDGKQVRDWIFVEDHCTGILAVLELGKSGGVYHFGGPGIEGNDVGISNLELVHLLLRNAGRGHRPRTYRICLAHPNCFRPAGPRFTLCAGLVGIQTGTRVGAEGSARRWSAGNDSLVAHAPKLVGISVRKLLPNWIT